MQCGESGWWRQGGSNPQPRHCERRALPIELCPHIEPENEKTFFTHLESYGRALPTVKGGAARGQGNRISGVDDIRCLPGSIAHMYYYLVCLPVPAFSTVCSLPAVLPLGQPETAQRNESGTIWDRVGLVAKILVTRYSGCRNLALNPVRQVGELGKNGNLRE